MAYQTNSGEFFDYLNQLLVEKKVSDTIKILSDATSVDPTLNGDLKFLKLRVNKKLMVPAGGIGSIPAQQIHDVIKLVSELKNAHARRNVMVSTLTQPSAQVLQSIPQAATKKTKKKRSAWPWVLLFLLLGGGTAGYFFKDKIMNIGFVQNFFSETPATDKDEKVKEKPKKKKKKISNPSEPRPTGKQLSSSLGSWYIQIASYGKLDQALDKRQRVAMSFDRSLVLQKNIGDKPNYRVIIPGFTSKGNAEAFLKKRKVSNLHVGAFSQTFKLDCADLEQEDTHIYICD